MKWGQAYGCEQKISYKRSPNCCEKDLTHWASTSEIVGKKDRGHSEDPVVSHKASGNGDLR